MSVTKFQLPEPFNAPCADISYQWVSEKDGYLVVLMHFSRVVGNGRNDLELIFAYPLALQWERASYGLIELPQDLPRIASGRWAYPSLIINNSAWADRYAGRICTEEEFKNHGLIHYAFISMNDLLHVLSGYPPTIKLVQASDA
jgi:hypothetical protein